MSIEILWELVLSSIMMLFNQNKIKFDHEAVSLLEKHLSGQIMRGLIGDFIGH